MNLTHHVVSTSEVVSDEVFPVELHPNLGNGYGSFEGPGHKKAVLLGSAAALALFEAQKEARQDPLTLLGNRRALVEELEIVQKSLLDDPDSQAALMFVDLDKFKKVNETEGHDKGDEVLKSLASGLVADELVNTLKLREQIFRIGGDEFVIVLTSGEITNGKREKVDISDMSEGLSQRVKQVVDDIALKYKLPYIGASIGVSKFDRDKSVTEVLYEADKKMFEEKRRNEPESFSNKHFPTFKRWLAAFAAGK